MVADALMCAMSMSSHMSLLVNDALDNVIEYRCWACGVLNGFELRYICAAVSCPAPVTNASPRPKTMSVFPSLRYVFELAWLLSMRGMTV